MRSSTVATGNTILAAHHNDLRKDAAASSYLLAHEKSTPDMGLTVEAGLLWVGSTLVNYAGGDSSSITNPISNPRIDVLQIDNAGTLSWVTGTEAASPTVPTATTGKVPLCAVYLRTTGTTIRDTDQGSGHYIYRDMRPVIVLAEDPSKIVYPFTADEDLTAGQTVGICQYSPSGRVARALRRASTVTLSFTPTDMSDINHSDHFVEIGADKFVVGWQETGADSLYCVVMSFDPATKTLSQGTASAATADLNTIYGFAKLNTDKFVVFYKEDASTTVIKYRVGTVSGTTITWGTAATFATAGTATQHIVACGTGTDKGVVYYNTSTNADTRVMAFTASGTVLTMGTAATVGANMNGGDEILMKKVATDKFVIYSGSGYLQIGTLSGTTITMGTESQYSTTVTNIRASFDIANPADNVLVFIFKNSSSSGLDIRACTVSGTTPTYGSVVNTIFTASVNSAFLGQESATSFIVFEQSSGNAVKLTLSGATLTNVGIVISGHINTVTMLKGITTANGNILVLGGSSTTFGIWCIGMAATWLGFVQSTVSRGNSVNVVTNGRDANQSGLIQGRHYQPNGSGGLTAITIAATINTIPTSAYCQALSATEVIKNN